MSEQSAGQYANLPKPIGERESLRVILQGKANSVVILGDKAMEPVDGGLGFKHEDVILNAKRFFAARLYQLSLELDQQITRGLQRLGVPSGATYEQDVRSLLTLGEGESLLTLSDLQALGFGLRGNLNPKMFEKLKCFDFMQRRPEEEPAMTFVNFEQVPVLWDMMYEQTTAGEDPDWEHFWGFRTPITHWDATSYRQEKIGLKAGLFSVIDQKLEFANSEVGLLVQQLGGGLNHRSLSEEFKKQAINELRKINDDAQADAWLQAQDSASWFSCFMEKLNEGIQDHAKVAFQTRRWKEKALLEIFSSPAFTYKLIHFACHCEPGKLGELLTKLTVHIAGEDVSLTVASMAEARGERPDDGPLVFLNACGTGQQGANAEPPGFPESWITKRGALAVVATLCPVPDLFAQAFARKFYKYLFSSVSDPQAPLRQRYLAEALLETRRYFMEECRNPLGLAYVLYAVKDACVEAG